MRHAPIPGSSDMEESKQPWAYKNRWPLAVGGLIVLLLVPPVVFMAFSAWTMSAPAIPYSKMEQLRVGMTDAAVQDLLGEPTSVGRSRHGGERWVYTRMTWAMYIIEFDAAGQIAEHGHDF